MVHGSGRTSAESDPIGRASEARASRGPRHLEDDHGRRALRFAALSRPRRARAHLQRHATHDPARRLQPPAHPL